LEGVQAPYSGRVVDAATGKPLKGALVMVVWQAEDTEIDGMKNVVAIREVATGADGSFTVPADFEATAPPRTLPATVWAFVHDHLPSSTNPRGAGLAADDFRNAGRVIELSPATTEEEHARALNILIAAPATWQGRGSAIYRAG